MFDATESVIHGSKIFTKEGLLEIINGLPLAIAVINQDRKVALANRAAFIFTNKNEAQLIGHVGGEAFGCIHHNDVPEGCGFGQECLKCRLRSTVLHTMEHRESHYMVETTMVFKNHGERHLRISASPIELNGDDMVLLAIEDITEAKNHEQTILEKEKLTAVIQTAGAICHEMNQPLMAIMGFSDILGDDRFKGDDAEAFNSYLKEIKKQSARLGEITRKLMNITAYETKEYLNSKIIDIDAASALKSINPEGERRDHAREKNIGD